jgi:predicted nucleic acid-binding Zn ribbon protein
VFKRNVQSIKDLVLRNLRAQGLETPLLQMRLVKSWPTVAGPIVARYTSETYIQNQTLVVRLTRPALRTELSMQRSELVRRLNEAVGEQVIADIMFC